jgi:hypothetical protein
VFVVSVVHESDSGCTRDNVLGRNDGVAAFQACLPSHARAACGFLGLQGQRRLVWWLAAEGRR